MNELGIINSNYNNVIYDIPNMNKFPNSIICNNRSYVQFPVKNQRCYYMILKVKFFVVIIYIHI